ncbi:MAG TPA: tetratricopeptide repeat protein [Actinoplanes sp.]|nr:tetratricopeptide repeat protein [Actinoplanes sp.]
MSQPSPLVPARQRAQALAEAGDTAGAIALLEHAVGLGKVNLGEDDPGVLAAAHQLARVHLQADDPSAARRVLEEAYAAGHWRLGDADPLLLEISYDLGVVAEELGNRHEARKALSRVVEIGEPVLGDFHWAVLKARAYLNGDTGAVKREPPARREQDRGYGPQLTIPAQREPPHSETVQRITPAPAEGQGPSEPAYDKRSPAIFAAVAAVLAAIIAVAALVFVLADRGGEPPDRPDQPVLGGGPPPADVRLQDFGTSVQISWSDPGPGKTSFIIAGGHPGEVLKPMGEVGPGQTTYRLQGLNDQLEYCFAVLAVYSTTEFASSAQSCTSR